MSTKEKRILLLLAAVFVILALLAALSLINRASSPAGFTPPPFEANAVAGTPDVDPDASVYRTLEIGESFRVALCGNLTVQPDGSVDFYFTSPADNTVWTRLVVYNEKGAEIGSTGILRPGEYVKSVVLTEIPSGTAKITLRFLSYEPETYYSCGTASAVLPLKVR